MISTTHDDVISLMPARRGHFLFESGHHGDLWLDLELLCLRPEPVRRLAERVAERLAPYAVDAVCGPLVEGAFVALMVAAALGVPFSYAERFPDPKRDDLFPIDYRLPRALRARVRDRRVAVVNDVINAGSAVRGALVGRAARRRARRGPRDARVAPEQLVGARRVPAVRPRRSAGQRARARAARR